jgi:hypothetical protein
MGQFLYNWQTLIARLFALLGGFAIFHQTHKQNGRDVDERARKRRSIAVVLKAEINGLATRLDAHTKVFEGGLIQKDIGVCTQIRA